MLSSTALLERLRIEEISAVSDPANELPGFMLRKAAGPVPDGITLMRLGDDAHPGFWAAVDDLAERLGEDHFEQVVASFTEYTKAALRKSRHDARDDRGRFTRKPERAAAAKAGGLPWAHRGASLIR